MLVGIKLPQSGLIQQTTKKIFMFFITKKTGFDISCSGDNLHAKQILFSWKNEKNISNCCLLKILPRVLSRDYGLHKQITHGSMHGKTYNKTCTKRPFSLHISSLSRAFAKCMYLLQSLGLIKRLMQRAKTRVSLHNCTF